MEKSIKDAINEYNKYRVPEVEAKLVSIDEIFFNVKFTGSFCETCGFYDYFDDFSIVLEDFFGLKTIIKKIDENLEGAVVQYELVN